MEFFVLLFCTCIFARAENDKSPCLRTTVLKVAKRYAAHDKLDENHIKAINEIREAYKNAKGAGDNPFDRDSLRENDETIDVVLHSFYVRYEGKKPFAVKRLMHNGSKNKRTAMVDYSISLIGEEDRHYELLARGSFDQFRNECKSTNLPIKKFSVLNSSPQMSKNEKGNSDKDAHVLVINDTRTNSEVPGKGAKSYGSVNLMYIICNSPTGSNRNLASMASLCMRYREAGFLPRNYINGNVGSGKNGGSNTHAEGVRGQTRQYYAYGNRRGYMQRQVRQNNSYGNQGGYVQGQSGRYNSYGGGRGYSPNYKSFGYK
ncbi:hypothetical protein Y032_0273g969 [Ancylostoma ceylanicum]|nr:hypothetical protein Y032_0273g969 [Ancylostoma ceylanicum]